ncbi:MAG: hypothetical protein QOH96_2800 [Blastocatellia bacterium]|jgi:hypothetical protein|nr:hypothetical protein [Blastocatellia bacterium]
MKIRLWFSLKQLSMLLFATMAVLQIPGSYAQKPAQGRGLALGTEKEIRQLPTKSKRYALIIGVDKYSDTQISTLGGATNDARSLADALTTLAGFPSDQVMLLSSDQPEERLPTRGNILRRLSNIASVIPADGLFVFAFAGHGLERSGQAFLLPTDAQVSDDVDLLEQTAVNVMTVKDRIRKAGVKQVVMILDACRNDPAGRANADNPLTQAYTKALNFDVRNREVSAFATLYATEVGHRAYEYKEKHQGYFTWALVEGLKGAAANDKGEVTLSSLLQYLQQRVPKKVLIDLGAGKDQRPFAVVEGYRADELVLSAPGKQSLGKTQNADIAANGSASRSAESTGSNKMYESGGTLAGTVWTGENPTSGVYTVEFLSDGKLKYTMSTGSVNGTWRQVGSAVHISVRGGYSVWDGTIDGMIMRGKGTNLEGESFDWILMPKN